MREAEGRGVEGMDAAVAVMVVAEKAVDRVVAEREVTVGAVAKEEGEMVAVVKEAATEEVAKAVAERAVAERVVVAEAVARVAAAKVAAAMGLGQQRRQG